MKYLKCFIFLILWFSTSCASLGLSSRVEKTSIGMTRQEVIKNIGIQYEIVHTQLTPDGDTIEILLFKDIYGTGYEYEFMNGILIRYTKIKELPPHDRNAGHKH
ncbi:MAG: hypothetical protein LIO77_10550 [Rikenellaceae bacterium]|nr:hypothetical protein [Rikenellaceae bacterium]